MKNSRSSSPSIKLDWLEKRHAKLDQQLNEYSGRHHLTVDEEKACKMLKKEKLRMKDEMMHARRTSSR